MKKTCWVLYLFEDEDKMAILEGPSVEVFQGVWPD